MTKTLHFMLDAHHEKKKPYLKHKGKEGVIKQDTFNTVLTESTRMMNGDVKMSEIEDKSEAFSIIVSISVVVISIIP